jgi:hypothetical protein
MVDFWFDEYKNEDDELPKYSWRIKYVAVDPEVKPDDEESGKRVERVKLYLDIFDFASQNRLKTHKTELPLDKVSSKALKDKITWLKSKIIEAPKSDRDAKKVDRRQDRNLRDDAY